MKARLTAVIVSVLLVVPFQPLASAGGLFPGGLGNLTQAVDNVTDVVTDQVEVLAPVVETVETVAAPVIETVETVAAPVIETVVTVVVPVVETVETVAAPVIETVNEVVSETTEFIGPVLPIVNGAILPTLPDLNLDATVDKVADLVLGLDSVGPIFENGNTRWDYELNGDVDLLELLQLDLGLCTRIDAWSLNRTLETVTNLDQLLAWLSDPLSDMPVSLSVVYEGILGTGRQTAELVTLDGEVHLLTTDGPDCASNGGGDDDDDDDNDDNDDDDDNDNGGGHDHGGNGGDGGGNGGNGGNGGGGNGGGTGTGGGETTDNRTATGIITVRVLDDSEELTVRPAPISGAEVTINGVTRKTNASGEVRFEGLAFGAYSADVKATNPRNASGGEKSGSGSAIINADHPEETIQVLLSWPPAPLAGLAGITGRICAPPMPGATVTAIGPDGRKFSTTVESDGTLGYWRYFSITNLQPVNDGAEELWTLRIEVPGKDPIETQVKVRTGQTTEMSDLTLACTGDGIPLQSVPQTDLPVVPVAASVATLVGGAFTVQGLRRRCRSKV